MPAVRGSIRQYRLLGKNLEWEKKTVNKLSCVLDCLFQSRSILTQSAVVLNDGLFAVVFPVLHTGSESFKSTGLLSPLIITTCVQIFWRQVRVWLTAFIALCCINQHGAYRSPCFHYSCSKLFLVAEGFLLMWFLRIQNFQYNEKFLMSQNVDEAKTHISMQPQNLPHCYSTPGKFQKILKVPI